MTFTKFNFRKSFQLYFYSILIFHLDCFCSSCSVEFNFLAYLKSWKYIRNKFVNPKIYLFAFLQVIKSLFKKVIFQPQYKNFSKLVKTLLLKSEVKMYYKMTPLFNYKVIHKYCKIIKKQHDNVEISLKQWKFCLN